MHKINITKTRAGHYVLTVRDARGAVILTDKYSTLDAARRAADPYRSPSLTQWAAALGPCGR